ncbi:MAG: hypothetical protein WA785_06495, partial [Candidatus Acidiferrales bacterium]
MPIDAWPGVFGALQAFQFDYGAFVAHVAGVEGCFGFDEQHVDFFVGDGKMLDAFGDDDEFAGLHEAGGSSSYDESTQQFTSKGKQQLVKVVAAWNRYVAL